MRVWTCSIEFNACHDKSMCRFFDLFCVFIDDGVRVCVGTWRGFKFSVSLEGFKIELYGILKQISSLTQTFVESWIDFEVAHLSVILPYPRFLP